MKKNTSSLTVSIISGALAGVITSVLILQNPTVLQRVLPAIPTPSSGEQDQAQNDNTVTTTHEQQVIATVKDSQKAVVSIVISKDVPKFERFMTDPNSSNPLDNFFQNPFSPFNFSVPRLQQNGTEKRDIGGGSGFLVSADGLVVTNRHVVDQEGAEYTVFLNDGTKHNATIAAKDTVNDIAILRIDAKDLPFLQFADSDKLQVGQTAIAIGNSLGEFRNTVSTGVVSGLSRSITAGTGTGRVEQLNEVIQTDAAINPGNSGGPLLNLSGHVIGVNVAIAQGSQNVGFALPSNDVQKAVESVQKTGKISRAYIGVRYNAITPAMAKANNLSVDYGALVVRGENPEELAVIPGSPANKAGITEGDIILELDGKKIDDTNSLASAIGKKQPGDTVSLKILSKGDEKTVSVKLEESKQR